MWGPAHSSAFDLSFHCVEPTLGFLCFIVCIVFYFILFYFQDRIWLRSYGIKGVGHHSRQDPLAITSIVSQDRHFLVMTLHSSHLGFQREADSLLSVTKLSTMSDSKNTRKAREMLLKLAEETSIFPASWELSERYLLVVVSDCLPHLPCWALLSPFLLFPGTAIPASPTPPQQ